MSTRNQNERIRGTHFLPHNIEDDKEKRELKQRCKELEAQNSVLVSRSKSLLTLHTTLIEYTREYCEPLIHLEQAYLKFDGDVVYLIFVLDEVEFSSLDEISGFLVELIKIFHSKYIFRHSVVATDNFDKDSEDFKELIKIK